LIVDLAIIFDGRSVQVGKEERKGEKREKKGKKEKRGGERVGVVATSL